ncbi:Sulfite reduction-associated complex DsrMKJOP protein DsrM (= HmeC) [Olavius sp. associated proteobacterium Delta 1]|nr:Sulfite reduction-associated complex DsrMKJOP protein DsrM (= HmeC) [Olavius sp. associated proteobacterium Delta 1]
MNARYMFSLIVVIALFLIAWAGAAIGLQVVFGIIIPYLALLTFIVGFAYKVIGWSRSAVPFRIPTTGGQQKSLPWIKHSMLDCPATRWQVAARMALEILTFRSLFRNTRMRLKEGATISYQLEIFLWVGALAFHYAFLAVLVRHLRFFTDPVPFFVTLVENVDSFFRIEILYPGLQFGLPGVFLSGIVLLAAVAYLFSRRLFIRQVRYISLASDYFPLFLIFGIALTGILMRYVAKIDVSAAKELTMGLVTLHPTIPEGVGAVFYIHLFFVSILLAYFPFSKLMHLGGIFLSPTRNLTTDTRANRHVNPWNYPVPVHTYEEYEDEFRDKMIEAGLPVDKMPGKVPAAEPAEAAAEEEKPAEE